MPVDIPFRDVLKLGSRGTQPVAVKRGLYRAGFHDGWDSLGDPAIAQEILGATAVANLKTFQRYHGLPIDGVYNRADHLFLQGSFDNYARLLYEREEWPDADLVLPSKFEPTHPTGGLAGYPAIDVFAKPGTPVGAPEAGTISRFSGKEPALGGNPGGAYGWSMYLTCPHAEYFLTHFGSRAVKVGQTVERADLLGTVCDAAIAGMATSASHIHEGKREL